MLFLADGGVVEDLQMTPGKVFSNDDCQSKWGTIGQIYGGHICIDGEGASGSCSVSQLVFLYIT